MAHVPLDFEVMAGFNDGKKLHAATAQQDATWNFNAPMYADFEKISKLDSVFDDDTVDESYFCVDHESASLHNTGVASMAIALEYQSQNVQNNSTISPEYENHYVKDMSTCQKAPEKHKDRSVTFHGKDSATDVGLDYWTSSDEVKKRYKIINKKSGKKTALGEESAKRERVKNLVTHPATSSPRDLDVIANVPRVIADCVRDDQLEFYSRENNNNAFKDADERSTPERKKNAAERGAGEGHGRGRNRVVDYVTSAKKRLSMSVDRGNTKLTSMRDALSRMNIEDDVRDGRRNGSANDLNVSTGRQSARRKILGDVENLSFVKERDEDGHISSYDVYPLPPATDGPDADPWLNWGDHDQRFVSSVTSNNEAAVSDIMAARPTARVPHTGVPFFALGGVKLTMIKPFSFEARNQRLAEQKERKLQQYYLEEKKAREFRAAPFPEIIYAEHTVKRREGAEDDVAGSSRGSTAVSRKMSFKAKPPTVLTKAPFVPRKSDRAPTEILKNFEDSAARRAEKRADVEATRRERLNRLEEERVEKERIKKEREETERKKERAKTVHRAQPIGYSR